MYVWPYLKVSSKLLWYKIFNKRKPFYISILIVKLPQELSIPRHTCQHETANAPIEEIVANPTSNAYQFKIRNSLSDILLIDYAFTQKENHSVLNKFLIKEKIILWINWMMMLIHVRMKMSYNLLSSLRYIVGWRQHGGY